MRRRAPRPGRALRLLKCPVDFYNEDGSENLVNEIGKDSGESVIGSGPGFLQIHGDGKWTVKVD